MIDCFMSKCRVPAQGNVTFKSIAVNCGTRRSDMFNNFLNSLLIHSLDNPCVNLSLLTIIDAKHLDFASCTPASKAFNSPK